MTTKDCDKNFLPWEKHHQRGFDAIKQIVTSRECLTTIDYELMPTSKIFVMTDASDFQSGAVLSFEESWEMA